MKKIKFGHKFLILIMVLAAGFVSFSCKSAPKSDSQLYECVYFTVDGEDKLKDMIYYSLELRSDGALITRFKNSSSAATSRDKYKLQGESFTMIVDSENYEYQLVNNTIVMHDKQKYDGKMSAVVRKFTLVKA